jgi:hypothetical protein
LPLAWTCLKGIADMAVAKKLALLGNPRATAASPSERARRFMRAAVDDFGVLLNPCRAIGADGREENEQQGFARSATSPTQC